MPEPCSSRGHVTAGRRCLSHVIIWGVGWRGGLHKECCYRLGCPLVSCSDPKTWKVLGGAGVPKATDKHVEGPRPLPVLCSRPDPCRPAEPVSLNPSWLIREKEMSCAHLLQSIHSSSASGGQRHRGRCQNWGQDMAGSPVCMIWGKIPEISEAQILQLNMIKVCVILKDWDQNP